MTLITSEVNKEALRKSYEEACKNVEFKKLVNYLKLKDEIAMKYTSSLENTVSELKHCKDCPGLMYCQNSLEGHVFYPKESGKQVIFSYKPCKHQIEMKNKENNKMTKDKELAMASMSDIDSTDKKRVPVIKWLINFCKTFDRNGIHKGLYLHGTFGCGKTYLISAAFNELSKKRISTEIIYFPELLRDLKNDFDSSGDRLQYLEEVDLLLIDDIGAEKVTEWGRDEILGTILQKRMNNYKTTFFTSNLTLEQLEEHLIINSSGDEVFKARRIIERIKKLTEDMELKSENKRN